MSLPTHRPPASLCILQCPRDSCKNCQTLREIDERIADTEKHLAQLKRERSAHLSSVTAKNDPITHTFPVEIISHIFETYVSIHRVNPRPMGDPTVTFDEIPISAPLRLGAVCRSWRAIAWSTPTLWTKLIVDVVGDMSKHVLELVHEWLERSLELPIHVALRLGQESEDEGPILLRAKEMRSADAMVELICQFWPKLETIDLMRIPWRLAAKFNNRGAVSRLESIRVGGNFDEDIPDGDSLVLFRETPHKPQPKELTLLSSVRPSMLDVDWSRLTTVHLNFVSRPTIFKFLSHCANSLVTVSLKAIDDGDIEHLVPDASWIPQHPINLPALMAISYVELDSREGFSRMLFDSINAPALRGIWYYGFGRNEMPIESMTNFIQRSSCKVVHFLLCDPLIPAELSDPDVAGESLLPLLRAMPSLRLLDISLLSDVSIEPLFLELAARPSHDRPEFLLPKLHKLQCSVYWSLDWDLLPKIYIPTGRDGSQIGDHGFKFSEMGIAQARYKLSVDITLRGDFEDIREDDDNWVEQYTLMALMAVKGQIEGTISVRVAEQRTFNFLEWSFMRCFDSETNPTDLMMYQGAKMLGLF